MADDYEVTYGSLTEFAKAAAKHQNVKLFGDLSRKRRWFGVASFDRAMDLAQNGWQAKLPGVMEIAESAVESVAKELEQVAFRPVWDVAGCEVDVARYLSGEPENMIDYEVTQAPRNGRVITLCASVAASSAVSPASIERRGQAVVALALALNQLGLATELWADASNSQEAYGGGLQARTRVLVKGANDELDPARIMFAYSHPAMNRVLAFASFHSYPADMRKALGIGQWYGKAIDPKRDLPEGTLYLPCMFSDSDIPDADRALVGYLRTLGIVGE